MMLKSFCSIFSLMLAISAVSQERFTDNRDGQVYSIIEVNELQWFGSNLKFKTDSSQFYDNSEMSKTCGMFYPIEEAFEACPAGWRLPTESEVKQLLKLNKRGKIDLVDTLNVDNCGRVGFGKSSKQGTETTYWIQTEMDSTYATHWHFFTDNIHMHNHNVDQRKFPVRCVRTN